MVVGAAGCSPNISPFEQSLLWELKHPAKHAKPAPSAPNASVTKDAQGFAAPSTLSSSFYRPDQDFRSSSSSAPSTTAARATTMQHEHKVLEALSADPSSGVSHSSGSHHREEEIANLSRQIHLVLLHAVNDAQTTPKNTRNWIAGRRLKSHHHVRLPVDKDYKRLARFIAGETVGVVLSGGGARGLAHLGVLRALEEAGIPIDYICGVSQGSVRFLASHVVVRSPNS